MALFGLFGNDRQMASTTYSGTESATAKAKRKRSARHHREATTADRQGQAWADAQRARQDKGWGRRR